MRVTKLLDVSGIGQTTSPSPEPYAPKTIFNSDGIVQVEIITDPFTPGTSLKIQGRVSREAPWVDLDLGGTTVAAASNYFVMPLMPEMRVVASSVVPTTFRVWIID